MHPNPDCLQKLYTAFRQWLTFTMQPNLRNHLKNRMVNTQPLCHPRLLGSDRALYMISSLHSRQSFHRTMLPQNNCNYPTKEGEKMARLNCQLNHFRDSLPSLLTDFPFQSSSRLSVSCQELRQFRFLKTDPGTAVPMVLSGKTNYICDHRNLCQLPLSAAPFVQWHSDARCVPRLLGYKWN